MAKGIDIETIRSVLADNFNHLEFATVTKIEPTPSCVWVTVNTFAPDEEEQKEVIAMMAFPSVGHGSGSGDLVELNDLVLVAYAGKETDHATVIARFPSAEETLPAQLLAGHFVTFAKPGKNLYLGSDTKINLGKLTGEAIEPLILGLVLQEFMGKMIDRVEKIIDEVSMKPVVISTAPGTPALVSPALAAALAVVKVDLEADRMKYLDTVSTNILSQHAFTERGT